MKITKISLGLCLLLVGLIFVCLPAEARIGVGVGAGKMEIDKPLRSGGIYELPILPVLNTGDEPSDYSVDVEYRDSQSDMKPEGNWFQFEPTTFYLEPGQVNNVKVTLTLPLKTTPGKYFAFLTAEPAKRSAGNGITSVGVAAASKLYFEVAPSNFFQGLYYRTLSLYRTYSLIINIVLGLAILIVVLKVLKKYIHLEIGIRK